METSLVFIACILLSATQAADWSYKGANGPSNWKNDYSTCGGSKQSPINIVSGDVVKDENLANIKVSASYSTKPSGSWSIKNNGHSVGVTTSTGDYTLSEGGLGATYKLAQFHFHWGSTDSKGSEHTMDGKEYPLEIHFVHYNSKYADLTTAIDKSDGLAVLGFFFEVDGSDNAAMQPIVDKLSSVTNKDDTATIDPMILLDLMGGDAATFSEFYRYSGSLTTPGCYESVTWTVFEKTVKISSSQLATFRTLKDSDGATMEDNYRPVLAVGDRTVSAKHVGKNSAPSIGKSSASAMSILGLLATIAIVFVKSF